MTSVEKIKELKELLETTLTPLVETDYVLLNLPYHDNFGDTLIWEGERLFLDNLPYKCIYQTDISGYNDEIFPENITILLQGGGNFTDIYTYCPNFRKRVISNNPKSKVIIFPQTVFYQEEENLRKDVEFYSLYSNVIICARDIVSYNIIKDNFPNPVYLLPDMAFFIDISKYLKGVPLLDVDLFVKRTDVELKSNTTPSYISKNSNVSDWPAPKKTLLDSVYSVIYFLCRVIDKIFGTRLKFSLQDKYRRYFLRERFIHQAVDFIEKYNTIYTTRLHAAILGSLMNKNIHLIDNSYGKNSSFYETWFKDVDNIDYVK